MASAFLLCHSDMGSLLPDGAPYGIKGRPWRVSEWEGLPALCALYVGLQYLLAGLTNSHMLPCFTL